MKNILFDLKLTQESGQTSQPPWQEIANCVNGYCDVMTLDNTPILLKVYQKSINELNIDYELPISNKSLEINKKLIEKEITRIYDLNFDLNKLYNHMAEDSKLSPAIDFCKGLRLFLAKDPFECIISSISSANNSIARWTKSITKIRQKWGEDVKFSSGTFYTFPSPSVLMNIYEDNFEEYEACNRTIETEYCINNLKSCGVGYRAPYMMKTSELFEFEMDLFEIPKMSYEEAFDLILNLPGVGPKVADCILLYGFGFKEAFPSDVWIKRIISHLYFNGEDISVPKVREFGMEKFGDYAGYVQLYLFHYARKSGLMKKLK
ncbi:DNA glycosylase [Methanobrevibacter cuticularis]|nr:DNA glycosylase [Methanobrevibacter cuticularis]